MSMIFKIAKPGFDVKTATDEQLAYSSEWDTLKASAIGLENLTIPAASTSVDLDITHGLGYAPAFFALIRISGTTFSPLPFSNVFTDLNGRIASASARSDTTKLRIRVLATAAAPELTLTFKYYIFHNQLDS